MNQKEIGRGKRMMLLYLVSTGPTMVLRGLHNYCLGFVPNGYLIALIVNFLTFLLFMLVLEQRVRDINANRIAMEEAKGNDVQRSHGK